MAPKQEQGSVVYMMKSSRYQTLFDIRMKPLQAQLNKYTELLSNVEREIEKIEAMPENEAIVYIRKYQLRQGVLKAVDVISDMTPEPIGGRWVRVSDNFLKYWLIFIAIGAIIVFIVLGASK